MTRSGKYTGNFYIEIAQEQSNRDKKLAHEIWKLATEVAFWTGDLSSAWLHHSSGGQGDNYDEASERIVQNALDEINADSSVRKKISKKNSWEPLCAEERTQVIQVFQILARWRDEAEQKQINASKSRASEPLNHLA